MQNVVYWIGVKNKDPHMNDKHGGFSYLDVSRKTWEWWCQKNNVVFVPYELSDYNPEKPGTKVTWQRWFDMKRVISDKGVTPNWIWAVDGSTMIRWDAPAPWNQQELNPEIVYGHRSLENLYWINEGIQGYKDLFSVVFDLKKYICTGNVILNAKNYGFLSDLEIFFKDKNKEIMFLENEKIKRGTDQPVFNYFLQDNNLPFDVHTLNPAYMLTHLNRFNWMSHNWQTGNKDPFFIKYGWLWMFSGFPTRGDRYELMAKTWELVKKYYE